MWIHHETLNTFTWLCVALHMLSLPLCIRTVIVQLSAEKRIVVFYPLSLTAIILSGAESCSQHDLPARISAPSQQQQRYMEPIERPASTLRIQSAAFSSNYTSFLFCLPLMPLMASKAVFPSPLLHFTFSLNGFMSVRCRTAWTSLIQRNAVLWSCT